MIERKPDNHHIWTGYPLNPAVGEKDREITRCRLLRVTVLDSRETCPHNMIENDYCILCGQLVPELAAEIRRKAREAKP